MQNTARTNRSYWATVGLGVTIGILYLIGFAAGGKPLLGVGALAMIAVILIGFVVSIARGGSGWPYDMIGFAGGLAYVGAVAFFRARG